jgi:N-acetylmuramoyl-L-alanine amidase
VTAPRRAAAAVACAAAAAAGAFGCGGASEPGGQIATQPAKQRRPIDLSKGRQWPDRKRARPRPAASPKPPAVPAAVPRPRIVDRPIPFPAKRRAEMAAYSRRHYGESEWRLTNPRVIVEHYTASDSFESAYNTFAADTPDVELHELPGVCSHFVVDSDGTIYRLVPTSIRCRHTVGLNYTAIGIEHVGTSDGQVMGDARQLAASLRLTRWLRCSEGIKVRNVIGHAESLSSPFHHEDVPALRTQTHGDMQRATMDRYRALLGRKGC